MGKIVYTRAVECTVKENLEMMETYILTLASYPTRRLSCLIKKIKS